MSRISIAPAVANVLPALSIKLRDRIDVKSGKVLGSFGENRAPMPEKNPKTSPKPTDLHPIFHNS
ncbi:MAG: hypothetical protein ACP5D4_03940 [Baaleninema sp.]